jgi:hypothetical protein
VASGSSSPDFGLIQWLRRVARTDRPYRSAHARNSRLELRSPSSARSKHLAINTSCGRSAASHIVACGDRHHVTHALRVSGFHVTPRSRGRAGTRPTRPAGSSVHPAATRLERRAFGFGTRPGPAITQLLRGISRTDKLPRGLDGCSAAVVAGNRRRGGCAARMVALPNGATGSTPAVRARATRSLLLCVVPCWLWASPRRRRVPRRGSSAVGGPGWSAPLAGVAGKERRPSARHRRRARTLPGTCHGPALTVRTTIVRTSSRCSTARRGS